MKPANSLSAAKRHSNRLITSVAVVVLAVTSLLGYLISSGSREAIREAETKTRNYAAITEARLDATLRRADADLQELVRTIPLAALSQQAVPRYARELDAELDSRLINFPELAALRIFDADGDRLYTTGSNTTPRTHISDRNYFRLLRDNPQAGLVFSEVLISRSRDRPSVVAVRALRDEQGVFRGIVLATIELDHFQKLFQSLELGAHGIASIYRSDDFTPVVRWPMVEAKINTPLPPGNPARAALVPGIKSATLEFSSSTDGMVRIYSFRVLDRYPFFVTAGLAREDVLAGWRERALEVGLSGLLLLGLLAGLLYWLWRAEAALKANEELMRSTFEQAAVGIAHIAPVTYRILMANDEFCGLLGYTRDELIGTDSRLLTPVDDIAAREAERVRVMAGEIKTSSSERRLIRKDGASLWINRSLSLVRDLAGQPQYFISVIKDITERKRAEQILILEHAVTRSLAEADSTSVALKAVIRTLCETQGWECGRYLRVDEQAGVLRFGECWNMPGKAIEQFVASKREAVIGLGVGLAGCAWQSGQPAWIADIKNDARSLRAAVTLETGMQCAFHFPLKSEGKTIGVLAFNSRKVREPDDRLLQAVNVIGSQIGQFLQRKQAEAARGRLAAIVENSGDAIVSRSVDRKILSWNAAAERMFGYAAAEVIGQSISLLIPPEREQESVRNRALLAQGIPEIDLETERLAKDGRRIPVSVSQSLIKDERGTMVGVAIFFRDIRERKQAEAALRDSEARYRSVIAAIAEGVVLRDKNARIVACNASAERILGRTLDQIRGNVYYDRSWQAIREDGFQFPEEERPIHVALRTGRLQSNIVQGLRKPDGSVLWLSMNVQPLFDESGTTLSGVVSTLTDITERKLAELRQTMEHAVTRVLAEAEAVAETAPRIIQTICETMGWHCGALWVWDKEAMLLRCGEMWGIDTPEIREFITASANGTITLEPADQGLVRRTYAGRQPIWIADVTQVKGLRKRASMVTKAGLHGAFAFPLMLGGEVLGVMEFFHRDVREPDDMLMQTARSIGNQIGQFMARRQAEEHIRHLANYDELTGLPNRSMFHDCLQHALAQAQRHARPLAVLFIDLDRFKNINDTLGHEAGDRVLKQVAERLRGCLRASDTIGRLGGDEFVLLLEALPQPLHVAVVAQKILAAVAKPYMVDAYEFHLTASIGISTYPADSDNMQTLLKNADIAMYRAKEQGKNNYQYYSAQMNVRSLERLELETDLRRALERSEFVLHYQPKVDIVSGRITGMEALVRWQHPTKGLIPPLQFIPLAEETGLIVPIGEWVLKTACARNKSWQEQGLPPLCIAVNLSTRQFAHENLLQDVSRVLDETGLDPAALEFEITESMVMHDPEHAVKLLTRLKAMGIHLAIDDFGTGYSSLSYLKRFPLDSVKIDRTFIRDLPENADDAAITRAIIAMAHSLRLKVIAEGVETGEQLRFLRDHGCDEMQGYYFSKPVPEQEFVRLVQAGSTAGSCPELDSQEHV